ncbi:MAG: hypothetical protein ACK4NY_22515 [Spirosomataceae bacterium]
MIERLKNPINVKEYVFSIDFFFQNVEEMFIQKAKIKGNQKALFARVFGEDHTPTLIENFNNTPDFAGYFLNLDIYNQHYLLSYLGIEGGDNHPEIPESYISELRNQYKKSGLERSFINSFVILRHNMSYRDVLPEVLFVFKNLFKFFYNHGIDGRIKGLEDGDLKEELEKYQGDRFGNYENWKKFWQRISHSQQVELLDYTVNVYKG